MMGEQTANYVVLEFLSLPANVGVARVAVASFAAQLEFTWGELEEIKVAISEAVTNAVVHAYRNGPGPVRVRAEFRDQALRVEVEDKGVGIPDIQRARQASFTTEPERMGLGFTFMESFMDAVEVESAAGAGTKIRMTKVPARKAG